MLFLISCIISNSSCTRSNANTNNAKLIFTSSLLVRINLALSIRHSTSSLINYTNWPTDQWLGTNQYVTSTVPRSNKLSLEVTAGRGHHLLCATYLHVFISTVQVDHIIGHYHWSYCTHIILFLMFCQIFINNTDVRLAYLVANVNLCLIWVFVEFMSGLNVTIFQVVQL